MKRDFGRGGPNVGSVVLSGRTIPALPDVVRARALARARSIVAGTVTVTMGDPAVATHRRGLWVALAASLALVFGAAGATAALRGWLPGQRNPSFAPSVRPTVPAVTVRPTARHGASDDVAPQPTPAVTPPAVERKATTSESHAAELRLLQRAQAAYTTQNFSGTLLLVAEHGRRFPVGRLAEQREALRVRSLVGSGRRDEARRAVSAFATRFPRSVLLQRLRDTTSAPE